AKHSRADTLRRFGISDDRRILLNAGRLTDQKNQRVLIRALAQVPSARLVIAGEGPLRGDHTALAQQLGVADRLHLLGDVTRDDTEERYWVTRMIDAYAALLGADANPNRVQWHSDCVAELDSTARAQRVLIQDMELGDGVRTE